jgi:hypothetical protein
MSKIIHLENIDRRYDTFLGIALKLEIGDFLEEKELLEKRFDKLSKENPNYTLVGGGSISGDYYVFNKLNLVEDK